MDIYSLGGGIMSNLIIKYIFREDKHVDPNFTYLTYGKSGNSDNFYLKENAENVN